MWDVLVVASDALFDLIDNEEVAQDVLKSGYQNK